MAQAPGLYGRTMVNKRSLRVGWIPATIFAAILLIPPGFPQGMDGRVEVRVLDSSGRGVPAHIDLASRSPEFLAEADADSDGRSVIHRVPPGNYRLLVQQSGFERAERPVEVRSAVPLSIEVVLNVRTVAEEVTVRMAPPLFEPHRPSQPVRSGREFLDEALGTTLGRSTVDVVTMMPGWLLEANAVLHPRGSEYDIQYVVDGMPLYENRSIAFAPSFENSEFEAVSVLTAGIPAEYGRRLGGVIALDTLRAAPTGHRSTLETQAGSFGTQLGSFSHQLVRQGTEVSFGVQGGTTDRYLDPPSLENFTNTASAGGANVRFARNLTGRDRLTVYARSNRAGFLVPNDLVQQSAGQRQDRRSAETSGQIHYQSAVSPRALVSIRGMVRDLTSELWSNVLATPVYVVQDRGFREEAVLGDISYERGVHTLKLGGDLRINHIREKFLMAEPGELPELDLDFRDRRRSVEGSFFAQDQFRAGNFAANLGVRIDGYSLFVSDSAVSPRLAASYYLPQAALQLYASYDRIFQPPPTENLLLSSAARGLDLDDVGGSLPVPPSRAHFFEIGFRTPLGDAMRVDVKHYWREFRNAIDDDVFLNTGTSFPITFASAAIEGTEVRLDVPRRKGISSIISYSNMLGRAASPVTGGLFIEGGEAEELRDVTEEFPISQDQRNTVAAMIRFEFHPRIWATAGLRYGSGLPVELEDDDDGDDDGEDEEQAIPKAILDKVNFARERVRPNLSLDFSVGARIWMRGERTATLKFDLRNATDRFNVVNFSGLFSGTALAPGRQATLQLRVRF